MLAILSLKRKKKKSRNPLFMGVRRKNLLFFYFPEKKVPNPLSVSQNVVPLHSQNGKSPTFCINRTVR